MSQNEIAPHPTPTDELIYEVYNELVSSLCIEVAYGVHRMAKNGTMKLSDIMIPRSTGRDSSSLTSAATDKIKEETKRASGGTHKLQSADKPPPTKRQRCTTALVSEKAAEQERLSLRNSPTPMVTRNASNNSLVDIWGRVLPKEPKKTVKCLHCGKCLSALRFAMHLDKCLIGNTRTTK